MLNYPSQKIVTVCDKCLTETCYKGQLPCVERIAGSAGTVTDTEENIAQLDLGAEYATTEGEPVFEIEEAPKHGIESVGPFTEHYITVDGYRVPRLTGKLVDGIWRFTFDGRFGCDVPERYGHGVAWMIANAQAVGAGFSCFGENSAPMNEFKNRFHCIGSVIRESVTDVDNVRPN